MNLNDIVNGTRKIAGIAAYAVTGAANVMHLAVHLTPLVYASNSVDKVEKVFGHPTMTIAALSFIPLAIYHLHKDRTHLQRDRYHQQKDIETEKEMNRLRKIERRYLAISQNS